MNKQQLIQKIQDEVKTSLESNISENLDNFEIYSSEQGEMKISCNEKATNFQNTCEFVFNWYN